jgi:hypothetical protein
MVHVGRVDGLGLSSRLIGPCFVSRVSPDDCALVEKVARDYFEGWYAASVERMERALHPDMVKRHLVAMPGSRQVLETVTRDVMIELTRMGGGSKMPPERRKIIIEVLDVSGDIAIARASSSEYLEYLNLAKCNGRWVIVNILWRSQEPAKNAH